MLLNRHLSSACVLVLRTGTEVEYVQLKKALLRKTIYRKTIYKMVLGNLLDRGGVGQFEKNLYPRCGKARRCVPGDSVQCDEPTSRH
jgi:hypothetical protein